jgi:iron complex outermembrane receptor protein
MATFKNRLRPESRPKFRTIFLFFVFNLFSIKPVLAENPLSFDRDIANASLEQLLDLKVTTVSKTPEEVRRAPAAVTVLTSEDIRRSGARNIPDLLRFVPGVQVASFDNNKWAVSIRGFNDRSANKLLVMIDGRSIYNPLFSGTLWETKDIMIDDIERIEVVRGPGGSAWGSNAVNGVINIITKNAKDTQGGTVVAGGGTEERAFTDARYGLKVSENGYLKVFGKYDNKDQGFLSQDNATDDSYHGMGGFRYDNKQKDDTFMLSGSYEGGDHNGIQDIANNRRDSVGNDSTDSVLNGRWERKLSDTSSLTVNGYYTRADINSIFLSEKRHTGEFNIQHSFEPIEWLQLTNGIQYRRTSDNVTNSDVITLDPSSRSDNLVSFFTEEKASLIPNELDFKFGARLEHNSYIDYELEPSAALSWTPTEEQTVWGSVARAVRTPSRIENDFIITIPTADPAASGTVLTGNRSLNSEDLVAYELGYRRTLSKAVYLDVATFYNDYNNLVILDGTTIRNSAKGDTYGFELAPVWQPSKDLKFSLGYSLLEMNLETKPGSLANPETTIDVIERRDPHNQVFFRSNINLSSKWQADLGLRYVDSVRDVSAYVVGDARLAWRATNSLELAIIGQNLGRGHHFEQRELSGASQVQQGVYGQLKWNF